MAMRPSPCQPQIVSSQTAGPEGRPYLLIVQRKEVAAEAIVPASTESVTKTRCRIAAADFAEPRFEGDAGEARWRGSHP